MQSTAFESSIPIENSGQIGVLVTSALEIVFPILFVTLRLFAKRLIGKSLDRSDVSILAALAFNIGLHIDCWVLVYKGGFGFHIAEIAARFGPHVLTVFFQGIMSFTLMWNVTICFSKLSVLLMYTSLIPVTALIQAARVIGVIIVLWNSASIVAGLALCQPFAMNWDPTIEGGWCGNQTMFYTWLGIINVIIDVFILGLPMPFLYKLQLPLRKKILLLGMFSIGFITCAITIYRQTMLPRVEFADMPYSGLLATIFSGLEPAVSISLACIPYLRPVIVGGSSPQASRHYTEEESSNSVSKKGARSTESRALEELNDNSSEIQLRPIQADLEFRLSVETDSKEAEHKLAEPRCIIVQKKWEVKVEE